MRYIILIAAVLAVYALLVIPPGDRLPDWAKAIILYTATMTAGILASDKFCDIWIGC